jgi:hypothetical protein
MTKSKTSSKEDDGNKRTHRRKVSCYTKYKRNIRLRKKNSDSNIKISNNSLKDNKSSYRINNNRKRSGVAMSSTSASTTESSAASSSEKRLKISAASVDAVNKIVNKNNEVTNNKANSRKRKIDNVNDSHLNNASLSFIARKKRELDVIQDRKRRKVVKMKSYKMFVGLKDA